MSVKKFRTYDDFDGLQPGDPYQFGKHLSHEEQRLAKVLMCTGVRDRNGFLIYEGDWLRSKSCSEPFEVKDTVSFLIMCGEYRAKNDVDIFDSLEVVGSDLINLRD